MKDLVTSTQLGARALVALCGLSMVVCVGTAEAGFILKKDSHTRLDLVRDGHEVFMTESPPIRGFDGWELDQPSSEPLIPVAEVPFYTFSMISADGEGESIIARGENTMVIFGAYDFTYGFQIGRVPTLVSRGMFMITMSFDSADRSSASMAGSLFPDVSFEPDELGIADLSNSGEPILFSSSYNRTSIDGGLMTNTKFQLLGVPSVGTLPTLAALGLVAQRRRRR